MADIAFYITQSTSESARVLSAGTVLLDAKAKRRYQETRPNDAPPLPLSP